MTTYVNSGKRPEVGKYLAFDHLTFWVGNAKQAATYYITRFGFHEIGYKGLETGDREVASHAVAHEKIIFVFQSPLNPGNRVFGDHLTLHGDAVKDVAFRVQDARGIYAKAVARGARSVREPWEESDANGVVTMATVATYGDVEHTFVDRTMYTGAFLPGYATVAEDPINSLLPSVGNAISQTLRWYPLASCKSSLISSYEQKLDFHRFWSVDDKQMSTEFSALRSIVMTDFDENIKMPINGTNFPLIIEPAPGKKKSQIQEYVDFHGGAGVQHIALRSEDIIKSVTALRARGTQFLTIPAAYYENLKIRLQSSAVNVAEDIATLAKLHILVDYDEDGYLLQIFTKPVEDRPTLFVEIIQRRNHQGFGAGNFKALFEAIEMEQEKRGNLS